MCLSSLSFGLTRDKKSGLFEGIGYKCLNKDEETGKLIGTDYLGTFRKDRWLKADNNALNHEKYPKGFHLFLHQEDAREYMDGPEYVVALFKFRKVVAFGKNETKLNHYKDCVVAEEMKFVKLV